MNRVIVRARTPENLRAGESPVRLAGGARRLLAAVFACALGVIWGVVGLMGAPAAYAAAGDATPHYRVDYRLEADGTLKVRETIDYVFSSTDRHGIFLWLTDRRNVEDGYYRQYETTVDDVSSPTGAPAKWKTERSGAALKLQIGDPDKTVPRKGQQYVIDYTVTGTVNRIAGEGGAPDTQELYVNPISTHWEAPIGTATVTITTPKPSTRWACYRGMEGASGDATKSGCTAQSRGNTVTFTANDVGDGIGMTTVIELPAGTVSNDEPVLIKGDAASGPALDALLPEWAVTGLGAGAVLLGAGAAVGGSMQTRRRFQAVGRDMQYAGVAPGIIPKNPHEAQVTPATNGPVAVRFEPPERLTPGLVGVVQDDTADMEEVTATFIDLAARGYYTLEAVTDDQDEPGSRRRSKSDSGVADWRIVRGPKADRQDELLPFEKRFFNGLMGGSESVLLSKREGVLGEVARSVQDMLEKHADNEKWYPSRPQATRYSWEQASVRLFIVAAVLLLPLAGLVATTSITGTQALVSVLPSLGVAVVALYVRLLSRKVPGRTAKGTAMVHQTEGFKKYLETAEAGQIRFEEAEHVFSRYLPYAIVFGVAERWAKVFDDVVQAGLAQGVEVPPPTWMAMPGAMNAWNMNRFNSGIRNLEVASAGAFRYVPATSGGGSEGASGRSGFSGGGGRVGGGGFGSGGGGSW